MKIKLIVVFLFLNCLNVYSQNKEQDTIKLLEITMRPSFEAANLMMNQYFSESNMTLFSDSFLQLLINFYLPIYDNYYTHEEIKELIKFYESELGQKTLRIANDSEILKNFQEFQTHFIQEIFKGLNENFEE